MLRSLDLWIVALYVVGMFVLSVVLSRGKGTESIFVNERSTPVWQLVFSIVSTTIGSGFFLSVVAEAYDTGISFGATIALVTCVTALVLATIAPRVKALSVEGGIRTVPELLSWRYQSHGLGRLAGAVVALGYLFLTALQFVGAAGIVALFPGIDFDAILLVAGVATVAYVSIGGLRSDIIADFISFLVMFVGIGLLLAGLLLRSPSEAIRLPAAHWSLFSFGGPTFFIMGSAISAVSAFVLMELWQRIFAAATLSTARRAFLISAIIQPLFVGAGVIIGLVAASRFSGLPKETAIFQMIHSSLPTGLAGLAVAALLAVLMTTVNSLVVVGGATLCVDVLRRNQPGSAQPSLMRARLVTVFYGLVALLLAYVFPDLVKLLLIGAFVLLPLCPAIIWAIFAKTRDSRVAAASIVAGLLTTLALLPVLPQQAFGPGFVVSLTIMVLGHRVLHRFENV